MLQLLYVEVYTFAHEEVMVPKYTAVEIQIMSQRKSENYIIFLVSIAGIGLAVESVLMGWEFWVPPLIIVGIVLMWVMNISQKPDPETREYYYLAFVMLLVFFHGVHESSLYDAAIVICLAMVGFSFLDHIYMINLFGIEYLIILIIQFILAGNSGATFSVLDVSRLVLHQMIVAFIYFCSVKFINDRLEKEEADRQKSERISAYDTDMEDFLSNISHELRTPVNVVNGMSDSLIKKNVGKEAEFIKDAGIRLAYQIENIQDYTECKRGDILLEEEVYDSTSLINDVVTSFRLFDNNNGLELVVDIDPQVPVRMRGDVKKLHKIFRQLLENAVKFTRNGGIFARMYTEETDYGVNLCIEMTDTGIGIDDNALEYVSEGMYQVNKKRNRIAGGIGLGLFIVYGFAHRMGGFVKIESEKNVGTTVRVTIPQKVEEASPCLALTGEFDGNILFHVRSDKYKVPKVRDFYRYMATSLATGIKVPLFAAETVKDIEKFREKMNVTYIFMGQEEYEDNSEYFDELSKGDIVVAVSAGSGFEANPGSHVVIMPKPIYGYPVLKVLNEGREVKNLEYSDNSVRPAFNGVRALVVDDEPMNLVVASSLFNDYGMIIDTAGSGEEAIDMFWERPYDVVFMDHMMPEMDGVVAMKHIKQAAVNSGRNIIVIALTANVVSGAREMFIREGFDAFIAKPIDTYDFERVMVQVLPERLVQKGGARP